MIRINQTLNEAGEYDNCVQASVASILELPINHVPHFLRITTEREWELHLRRFTKKHGFDLWRLGPDYQGEGFYLVTGFTDRKPGVAHMVVYENGLLSHDPHPSKSGLVSVLHTYFLVPLDPSKHVRG